MLPASNLPCEQKYKRSALSPESLQEFQKIFSRTLAK
jgi:hypothetical protein